MDNDSEKGSAPIGLSPITEIGGEGDAFDFDDADLDDAESDADVTFDVMNSEDLEDL